MVKTPLAVSQNRKVHQETVFRNLSIQVGNNPLGPAHSLYTKQEAPQWWSSSQLLDSDCYWNGICVCTFAHTYIDVSPLKDSWARSVRKWSPIKVFPGHFKLCTLDPACCHDYSRDESELGGLRQTGRQAGWTLISPSMFDRTECKNNTNPCGPYGWFWEDQLLGAFKAIIFISHPRWVILISDEGPLLWRQSEDNERKERTTCAHQVLKSTKHNPYIFHTCIKRTHQQQQSLSPMFIPIQCFLWMRNTFCAYWSSLWPALVLPRDAGNLILPMQIGNFRQSSRQWNNLEGTSTVWEQPRIVYHTASPTVEQKR